MKDNTYDEDSKEDKKNKLCKLIVNMRQLKTAVSLVSEWEDMNKEKATFSGNV